MTFFGVRRFDVDTFENFIFGTEGDQKGEFLRMEFDRGGEMVFRAMEYRFVSDWMGPEVRLGLRAI